VKAVGHCRDGNRTLPVHWTTSYRFYDAKGVACGDPVPGKAPGINVPSGAAAASYTVRLISKVKVRGMYPSRTVSGKLSPGGDDYECGKISDVKLPAQSVVCPWSEPFSSRAAAAFKNCGAPNDLVAFATPAKMVGNTVTSGRLASQSGVCRNTDGPVPPYEPAPPKGAWLDLPQQATNIVCDGKFLRVNLSYIAAVNQSGQKCEGAPHLGGLRSFQIPDFGGTFYALFTVGLRVGGRFVYESQTGVFHLNGSVDPCQYMAPVN
jgi:hypothetical protein